ncbi:hypothetical protein [Ensifer adhaerens]|uniref:hypothetical protein n=1 Tax=Ensifer adhaerens TaxID=106592 RepID=UPI001C4DF37B|nr:hypothetical protein [Ensifer adhaerens]MBW0368343.1 hypothetical protein [Ensifer adhaerens]UCM24919.1 hypothetical protein LDL63_34585 [Ensifer adhaerens]
MYAANTTKGTINGSRWEESRSVARLEPSGGTNQQPKSSENRQIPDLGRVFALVIGWTALCLLGYLAADPLIAWLKVAVLGVVDSGQGLAEAVGGKVAGETVQLLKSNGIAGQALGLAEMIAKPAILAVWFLGIVVLAVLPAGLSFALRVIRRPFR